MLEHLLYLDKRLEQPITLVTHSGKKHESCIMLLKLWKLISFSVLLLIMTDLYVPIIIIVLQWRHSLSSLRFLFYNITILQICYKAL